MTRDQIRRVILGGAFARVALGAAAAVAQPAPTIKRTILQTFDVPGTNYQTVVGTAEIVGGASIGRHTHPGIESGYLLEGDMVLIVAGEPDKPVKVGQAYMIGTGLVHDGKAGPNGAKVVATWVIEKGKPLATPAP